MVKEKTEYRFPKGFKEKEKVIWFGGDYNPEQWTEEMIEEDLRLMKMAKVNIVTLGVFAWGLLEPEEGVFQFEWLDQIINRLYKAGIAVDLATGTATPPRWLTYKHPEILPCDEKGNTVWPGGRQHWRPTSRIFREYALKLTEKMAEHYKRNPAVRAWHISNELGCHNVFDYSEDAARSFREWLKEKYKTLEALNQAWNGTFWSQMATDWEQIIPPRSCYGGINPTTLLDFKRFSSDALLEYYCSEAEILHRVTPEIPVTTNLMVLENQTNPVDCFKWGKYLDFVSNDHYYLPGKEHLDEMSMSAAIVSGIAEKKPWFLMENSTSSVNWRPINLRKQTGEIIRDALVHMANGADGICFFQWRQSKAGAEKFHSSMLPHSGTKTKIFQEICRLGSALERLEKVRETEVCQSRIAMIYDYDSWWSYEKGLLTKLFDYRKEFFHWYQIILDTGITPDITGKDSDWEKYEVVIFPVTLLAGKEIKERAEQYVKKGGKLVITYGSGVVDEYDHVYLDGYPGAFCETLGVKIEEFVALEEGHTVELTNGWKGSLWVDDIMEITDDCQPIAYIKEADGDLSLPGQPAITKRKRGRGFAFYVGTKLFRKDGAEFFAKDILEEKMYLWRGDQIPLRIKRSNGEEEFEFVFNRSKEMIFIDKIGGLTYLSHGEERKDEIVLKQGGVVVFSV